MPSVFTSLLCKEVDWLGRLERNRGKGDLTFSTN
jgi:hypothetical protein